MNLASVAYLIAGVSPSVYFQIVGSASFEDDCGILGTKAVTSTVAVPLEDMSTVFYPVPDGGTIPTGIGAWAERVVKPLDLRDLECPTWGLASAPPKIGPNTAVVGYPYFPMLVPPPQLMQVDEAWSKCLDNHWLLKYGIFDPPHALHANSYLASPPTSTNELDHNPPGLSKP